MKLTRATFNKRSLTTKPISNPTMRYVAIMIRHKIYFTNQGNYVSAIAIHTTYETVVNGRYY